MAFESESVVQIVCLFSYTYRHKSLISMSHIEIQPSFSHLGLSFHFSMNYVSTNYLQHLNLCYCSVFVCVTHLLRKEKQSKTKKSCIKKLCTYYMYVHIVCRTR